MPTCSVSVLYAVSEKKSGDGGVNLLDCAMLAAHWYQSGCGQCAGADLTGDESVDMNDLQQFVANWLAGIE